MTFITLIHNHNTERFGVLELWNNHMIVVLLLNDQSIWNPGTSIQLHFIKRQAYWNSGTSVNLMAVHLTIRRIWNSGITGYWGLFFPCESTISTVKIFSGSQRFWYCYPSTRIFWSLLTIIVNHKCSLFNFSVKTSYLLQNLYQLPIPKKLLSFFLLKNT